MNILGASFIPLTSPAQSCTPAGFRFGWNGRISNSIRYPHIREPCIVDTFLTDDEEEDRTLTHLPRWRPRGVFILAFHDGTIGLLPPEPYEGRWSLTLYRFTKPFSLSLQHIRHHLHHDDPTLLHCPPRRD